MFEHWLNLLRVVQESTEVNTTFGIGDNSYDSNLESKFRFGKVKFEGKIQVPFTGCSVVDIPLPQVGIVFERA
jgi:hypothetical protein